MNEDEDEDEDENTKSRLYNVNYYRRALSLLAVRTVEQLHGSWNYGSGDAHRREQKPRQVNANANRRRLAPFATELLLSYYQLIHTYGCTVLLLYV